MTCQYASSGCNYPEGECLGLRAPQEVPTPWPFPTYNGIPVPAPKPLRLPLPTWPDAPF